MDGAALFNDESSARPREQFSAFARSLGPGARVLEAGTRQAAEGSPTHSRALFPNVSRENYVMVDLLPGNDVDVVADLHHLPSEWTGRFDAVMAIAVFEHLARPWLAAKEVARVLSAGGIAYIATHQTFPLHGHPSDFFRFSKEALSLLVEDAGLRVLDVAYQHRARIVTPEIVVPAPALDAWNAAWPSYLVVHLIAQKPAPRR